MSPYEYWINPMLFDVNRDMQVDDMDLLQCAAAFGSVPGRLNWNPLCDFNGDNIINVVDLFDLSKHYGQTA